MKTNKEKLKEYIKMYRPLADNETVKIWIKGVEEALLKYSIWLDEQEEKWRCGKCEGANVPNHFRACRYSETPTPELPEDDGDRYHKAVKRDNEMMEELWAVLGKYIKK